MSDKQYYVRQNKNCGKLSRGGKEDHLMTEPGVVNLLLRIGIERIAKIDPHRASLPALVADLRTSALDPAPSARRAGVMSKPRANCGDTAIGSTKRCCVSDGCAGLRAWVSPDCGRAGHERADRILPSTPLETTGPQFLATLGAARQPDLHRCHLGGVRARNGSSFRDPMRSSSCSSVALWGPDRPERRGPSGSHSDCRESRFGPSRCSYPFRCGCPPFGWAV